MYVGVWKRVALVVAGIGMIIPPQALTASEKAAAPTSSRVLDVRLTEGGMLSGQVVDAQGKPQAAAAVALRFKDRVVARTTTDLKGRFAVRSLRGGVHSLTTAHGSVPCRFWSGQTAPPAAQKTVLLVSDNRVLRAQCADDDCGDGCGPIGCGEDCGEGCGGVFGGHSMLGTGLVVAAVAVGIVALADSDDNNNRPASP